MNDKENNPAAPIAKIISSEITYHNQKYIDDYAWLKEKTNQEVIDYLNAENAYMESKMAHTKEFQENLYKEMVGRIKETDSTAPEKLENYYYYSRTEQGKQYRIYCRKKDTLEANEEILLDLNVLAEGKEYLSLGNFKISPDHKCLAYSLDTDGSEAYTIYFKDLESGSLLSEQITNASTSGVWASDNKSFFYTTLDDAKRPYKAFKHVLGTEQLNDQEIYHEKDEAFFLNISKTNSKKYILITLVSKTTSEVRFLNADNSDTELKLVEKRVKDTEYYLEHRDDTFFIITNIDNAFNFKVMKAPIDNPGRSNWKDFIAHRDNVRVDYIHVFKNHLVIYERENGLKNIRILSDNEDYYIDFPEPVYDCSGGSNRTFETNILRFHYDSLTTPDSVYEFNMDTKERELIKRDEVLGGYNPDDYQAERIFAKAGDGTEIPISLVYKKGIKKDGSNPLYLYGYGSYEISIDAGFSSRRLSLIDRGFVYAIAHIRGGGDMGRQWYENGKFLKKKNTFTDFIACAEHLINEKYTSKEKILAMGGSAGGMLMGAVINLRPDLFKAVVAHVPFVDVINTMMDPSLPLTVIEYDEWGDPNDKKYFDYMMSYSPYDNIEEKEYPNLLITGGLNDPRVGYWEPAKWTAKLRKMKKDNNILLLKTNMGAGHGGASGRYEHLREIALEYAFMLDILGINS